MDFLLTVLVCTEGLGVKEILMGHLSHIIQYDGILTVIILYIYIRMLCVGMSNRIFTEMISCRRRIDLFNQPSPTESLWFVAHPRVMT